MTRAETRYGPKHWQAAQRGALECSPWAKAQSVETIAAGRLLARPARASEAGGKAQDNEEGRSQHEAGARAGTWRAGQHGWTKRARRQGLVLVLVKQDDGGGPGAFSGEGDAA